MALLIITGLLMSTELIQQLRVGNRVRHLVQSINESTQELEQQIQFPQFKHPQCHGGWMAEYAQLHQSMLRHPVEEQKILIMDAYNHGLGDRMTTLVSAFMVALLNDYMFKVKWAGAPLESAIQYNYINWTVSPSDYNASYGRVVDLALTVEGFVQYDDQLVNEIFSHSDLSMQSILRTYNQSETGDHQPRTVIYQGNQGQLYMLFENPKVRQRLHQMGLNIDNAFGCVMNFLFTPRQETIDVIRQQWKQVTGYTKLQDIYDLGRRRNSVYRPPVIGLQIRFGDQLFSSNDTSYCRSKIKDQWFKQYIQCAESLASDIDKYSEVTDDGQSRFYLVTDCEEARKYLKKRLGNRLITYIPSRSPHSAQSIQVSHIDKKKDVMGFRLAVSEAWLFSFADYFVITKDSSFGRLGALMSIKLHSTFSMKKQGAAATDNDKKCARYDFDDFRTIAWAWTRY
ncbi:hypothetical protein MIR68_007739 [Amoeboaphelidium protococcarum]|nr:hypothetical protein MIR68_007739 [Amoeboaphelidium protococcarum]